MFKNYWIINFGGSLTRVTEFSDRIKWVFLNKQPCQPRPTLIDINSKEPLYIPFVVRVNKCSDGPYDRIFARDTFKKYEYESI